VVLVASLAVSFVGYYFCYRGIRLGHFGRWNANVALGDEPLDAHHEPALQPWDRTASTGVRTSSDLVPRCELVIVHARSAKDHW